MSTPRGARGPYAKGVQRREDILDRALEVYAEVGFRGTTLRAVGEAIGVTHAALLHYFASTDDLLLAVLRRADDRALAAFDVTGVSAASEFSARMAAGSQQVPGLTALYSTMTARAVESDDHGSRTFFAERYQRQRHFAELVLQSSRDQGTIRTDISLSTAAALLIAASDGLTTQWLIDPTAADIGEGLHLLDRLLLPPEPPPRSESGAGSRRGGRAGK